MNSLLGILFSIILTAGQWTPVDYTQFWVQPETESELHFETKPGAVPDAEFVIRDSKGDQASAGQGTVIGAGKNAAAESVVLTVKLKLPQGYYELEFPKTKQYFGLGVLPLPKRNAESKSDPFFAIDGALSGLAKSNDIRKGLIQSAKKIGIDMIRERLGWGLLERKEGNFGWTGRYSDEYRFFYKENGVDVLELFHDAPDWIGLIEKKYPNDMNKARTSWRTIAKKWSPTWGAIEIWNEPEIGFGANMPADQYVPLLKSLYQMFKSEGVKTPVVGGVNALFNEEWLVTAADSKMLDYCDIYSFHTYQRADLIENLYQQYHDWLKKYGHAGMPVWITECGRPWKIGPARALGKEDLVSAIDIVMKGVEARACGFDRYFPFVYAYYEERENNFGMTGKEGSPLRSIVAYAQMIRRLSGTEYVGDWKEKKQEIDRARVFADSRGNKTLVLYQSAPKDKTAVRLPFDPVFIESVTGENVKSENGSFDFSEGFLYIGVPGNAVFALDKETMIGKIRAERKAARPAEMNTIAKRSSETIAPFVLRFDHSSVKDLTFTPQYYLLDSKSPGEIKLGFDVFSFSGSADKADSSIKNGSKEQEFKITVDSLNNNGSAVLQSETLKVPTGGRGRFEITVTTDRLTLVTPYKFNVNIAAGGRSDSVRLILAKDLDPEKISDDFLKKHFAKTQRLSMRDPTKWIKSCAACGSMKFVPAEKLPKRIECSFDVKFQKGDRWIYPLLSPEITDMTEYDGFIICARAKSKDTKTSVRMIVEEASGENWIVWNNLMPADGKWHLAFVPFKNFHLLQGKKNGIFERDRIRGLKFGANTPDEYFKMDLGMLYLYKQQ